MTEQPTRMIFRTFKDGEVIALMPEIPHDRMGYYCQSYMHVGQHGAASTGLIAAHTKPSTLEERRPLMRELVSIGYIIELRKRETPQMRNLRMDAA